MQVKQRLRLNSTITAVSMFAMVAGFFLTIHHVNRALDNTKIADAILTTSFERLILRTDHHRTGSERTKAQLVAKHAQVGALLKKAKAMFRDPEDQKTIADLLKLHESVGKTSRALRERMEKRGFAPPDPLSAEVEDRLLRQLNMKIYETILLDSKLQASSNAAVYSAISRGGIGIGLMFLLMAVATRRNSRSLSSTIAGRIGRLRDGAAVIGNGDLDHRIEIMGHDEFVDLADSFNAMTAKLRASYRDLEREVEERRRAEDDLRESEEKLSLALRSAEMGVWLLDLKEKTRHFDNHVCHCLGINPATFRGTPEEFFATVHPDDRDALKAALALTIETGVPYQVEYRVVWPDRQIRYIATRGQLTLDSEGNPSRIDGLLWDITERKLAEEALQESEHRFRQVVESLPQLVWTCAPDGACVYLSPQWLAYTGVPEGPQLGYGWLEQVYPDDRARTVYTWQEAAARGENFILDFRIRRSDGVFRWFHTVAVPLHDDTGTIVKWFGTNTDIEDMKHAEEALQKANLVLAEQMEERLKELREKEVLLKEVHHRVKNNLQVISSLVGLQADASGEAAVRDVLKDVTYRVRSMALVHEKLYQSESLATIDFSGYIRSLLNYLWRAHGATAAEVALALDLEPVTLPVDAAMPCGLILNELAGNALKHAFRGRTGGEVAVSLHKRKDGCVFLSVRDNGNGIPEKLDWRNAPSLGLRLVQMLAGQLKALVELNRANGTEFRITFNGLDKVNDGEQKHD